MSEEREATAHHEAAHAVMARECGLPVEFASIEPDADTHGRVRQLPPEELPDPDGGEFHDFRSEKRLSYEWQVMVCLAGRVAEERVNPNSVEEDSWQHDHASALYFLRLIATEHELDLYYELLSRRTAWALREPRVWAKVKAVAAALLKRERLSCDELDAVIRDALAAGQPDDDEDLGTGAGRGGFAVA